MVSEDSTSKHHEALARETPDPGSKGETQSVDLIYSEECWTE